MRRTRPEEPRREPDEASMTKIVGAGLAIAIALLPITGAAAQTQNRVDAKKDWSIFEASQDGGKVCWIASTPTKSVALRGGKQVQVNRGDIYLMVAVRPADGVKNEVSFISGYPLKKGSEVEAKVGDDSFEMFTSGENAWPPSPEEDDRFVAAFKRGIDARVEGVSQRGTTTVDTFSLIGFTDALEAATERCQ